MQTLKLAETGIELDIPDNFHFHDDGCVRSLGAHTIKLKQKHNLSQLPKIIERGCVSVLEAVEPRYRWIAENTDFMRRLGGRNYCFFGQEYKDLDEALEKGDNVNDHIYLVDGLTPIVASMIKGHEETHTLAHLHRLDALKEALARIRIDASNLDVLPLEAICQVGGFYAMVTNNPNEVQYKFWGSPYNQVMYEWLKKNSKWVGHGN